jgi:hypothetical protein
MRLLLGFIFAIILIIAAIIESIKEEYEIWKIDKRVRKDIEELIKKENAEKLNKIIEDNKDEEE